MAANSGSVTLVVTSCGRHDLLKRTLDSFAQFNTHPIKETIVIEDGDLDAPKWFKGKWIKNGKRKGQIYSIDRAYSEVTSPYIYHCEDDWEFTRSGFIEESLDILVSFPNVLQVWHRDDSEQPRERIAAFPFEVLKEWNGGWGFFAFNPGLRRFADYKKIGSYGRHVGYDPRYCGEMELSILYRDLGFRVACIDTACHHIGEQAHVAWDTAPPPPKVLVAIPACHKYAYAEYTDDRIHKNQATNERVEAVRATWAKYFPAFESYVTFKFFYGQGSGRAPLEDEVFLDCPDDYKGLPHKVKAIYKWALDNGYDYVFKGDDDTFIYLDRLMASGFEKYDYSGFAPNDQTPEDHRYASGGSGYWISRKAMQYVVKAKLEAKDWAEDLWVGKVLYAYDIKVHRDARYLPGFWEHFTDIKALPKNHSYITMHACTPRMMKDLFEANVTSSFRLLDRAMHEFMPPERRSFSAEEFLQSIFGLDVDKQVEAVVLKFAELSNKMDRIEDSRLPAPADLLQARIARKMGR